MPELSILLRQRLRATEDRTLQHPDPDTLNAYVEELLPSPERERTLQHLSRCSQCREVMALIMPETAIAAEFVQQEAAIAAAVIARPGRAWREWFRSPAFGFAGSLAATVLGVALILRLSPNPQSTGNNSAAQHPEEAQLQQPSPAAKSGISVAPSPEQAQAPAVANSQLMKATPAAEPAHAQPADTAALRHEPSAPASKPAGNETTVAKAHRSPVVVADLRQQDYINKAFLASSYESQPALANYRNLPQAPAPVQSNLMFAPPTVVAGNAFQGGSGFVIPSNPAGGNQGVLTFYATETENGRSSTLIGKIVELGKLPLGRRRLMPPIRPGSLGTSAMFRPGMAMAQGADTALASKNSSENGTLAGSQAFSSRALGAVPEKAASGASLFQWKVLQGKLLRSSDLSHWSEQNPGGENIDFSVISPNGLEIWAGGAQAALMHSRDGGTTWQRITLGASATGTITSIEVAGQNVLVKSSSGQSWASQDGGNSWTLQD